MKDFFLVTDGTSRNGRDNECLVSEYVENSLQSSLKCIKTITLNTVKKLSDYC